MFSRRLRKRRRWSESWPVWADFLVVWLWAETCCMRFRPTAVFVFGPGPIGGMGEGCVVVWLWPPPLVGEGWGPQWFYWG